MSHVGSPGLPLYRQIEADLRDRIRERRPAPGAQVATEPELMAEYGVSRATVRQALAGLVAEGLLEIRRGLGTYVTAPRFEHTIGGFYSFSREIERHGLEPGHEGPRPADAAGRRRRGRGARDRRRARRSSRCADSASPAPDPLVVETSHLPAARFPGLEDVDFSAVRLYDTLINALRLPPDAGPGDVRAGPPDRRRGRAARPAPRRARRSASSASRSTRTTRRSSSAGARSAAIATATRWSSATDDRLRRPADLARELDVRRGDRGRARRRRPRAGRVPRRPRGRPSGS